MSFLAFLLEAGIISLSGVMAPGPITTVVIGKGNEQPHAGALVAIGHGMIEIPLMVAVFYGVGRLLKIPHVQEVIALAGGFFLLFMAIGMFQSLRHESMQARKYGRSAVLAGVILTIANPYFLVWWATVGASLISRSMAFGLVGFIAFGSLHWLCDFVWDDLLSIFSFKGGQFFGRGFQRAVFLVCGVVLLFFGIKLLMGGVLGLVG
jgi:threonine/homoserine/homoserine lactone efflux protein